MTSTTARTIIPRLGGGWVSVAISLLICAVAAFTLYTLLRDIDLGKVVTAMEGQPAYKLAIAGLFVVCGYLVFTFYDLFALRMIGCSSVPYSIAALASFTSSTIGHSLGAAVLTGGLIRLRIYSAWGLTVVDVAKIAFVTGMTFWLGHAVLLGGAAAFDPQAASAVDQLPLWANRAIGLTALISVAAYLTWLAQKPRAIGRSAWRIVLPDLRLTLLQIAIGATDLTLVTLAMYTLLPPNPPVGLVTVLVASLTATMLGTVSHAPGGLGVIEATMLVALPQFQKEELLATLLTFRILYFMLPLCLAALSLGIREMWMLARAASARRDGDA